eukprot:15444104-Alexandrium_andersonii.AAC.1
MCIRDSPLQLPGGLPPPRPPALLPGGLLHPRTPQKNTPAARARGTFWGVQGGGSPPGKSRVPARK